MENDNKDTVLVVDDTPANLAILITILQQEGYKVRAVTNGLMGIRAAELNPPDIIMLDVNMPDMNGYEVCRTLKRNERLQHIPVIFVSALSEQFDKVEAFESGGVDYITKPIQIQESLARVKTHLSLSKAKKLIEDKNTALENALTQLRETQSQLIQSEKMASLGVLTAGIAHEINNPVSFIHGSSVGLKKNISFFLDIQSKYETLLADIKPESLTELNNYKSEHSFDERINELTLLSENIYIGAQRISAIIQSLRLFSRLDEIGMKEINILENLESTLLLLQPRINNRIQIVKKFNPIPPVPCFPARLSQVFMNLISNAIDAIESKEISAETEQIILETSVCKINQKEFVRLSVCDSGPGVKEDIINKIFDPFYTTKPVGKGLGLGLSISNNILKEHGGAIEVKNNPSQGAEFSIYLPF